MKFEVMTVIFGHFEFVDPRVVERHLRVAFDRPLMFIKRELMLDLAQGKARQWRSGNFMTCIPCYRFASLFVIIIKPLGLEVHLK